MQDISRPDWQLSHSKGAEPALQSSFSGCMIKHRSVERVIKINENGWVMNETGVILICDFSNYPSIYWETKKTGQPVMLPHWQVYIPIGGMFFSVSFECFFVWFTPRVSVSLLSIIRTYHCLLSCHLAHPRSQGCTYCYVRCLVLQAHTLSITELPCANKWETRLLLQQKLAVFSESMKLNQAGAIRHQAKVYKWLHGFSLHSKGHAWLIACME